MTSILEAKPRPGGILTGRLQTWAGLPYLDRLLDPDVLAEHVGHPVRLRRIRIKPSHSLLVAWERTDALTTGLSRFGWAAVLTDPAKVAGIRRRAARAEVPVSLHSTDGPQLLSGGLLSDPGLAREIAHARRYLPSAGHWRVLAYNPGRRVVLAVPGVPGSRQHHPSERRIVRITADDQDHLVDISRTWMGFGVPTLPITTVGRRGTATESPLWGAGDLAARQDPAAARAAGRHLAQLHRASAGAVAASPLNPVPQTTQPIGELLGELRPQLIRIGAKLRARLTAPVTPCLVHGDLSPDQILSTDEPSPSIRIIDLDRARTGSAGLDLGSWTASCRPSGHAPVRHSELAEGFLAGYAERAQVPELAPWHARALLTTALEPLRQARDDWQPEIAVRLERAEATLDTGELR